MTDLGDSNPLRVIHNAVATVLESSRAFQSVFGTGSRFRYFFFEKIADLASLQPGDTPFAYITLQESHVAGHSTSSSTIVDLKYGVTVVAPNYELLLDAVWALAATVIGFQRDPKFPTLDLAFRAEATNGEIRFDNTLLKSAGLTITVHAALRTDDVLAW